MDDFKKEIMDELTSAGLKIKKIEEEAYFVQKGMLVYGGSFVKHLGNALARADPSNTCTIKKAFPEYWKTYLKFGKMDHDLDSCNNTYRQKQIEIYIAQKGMSLSSSKLLKSLAAVLREASITDAFEIKKAFPRYWEQGIAKGFEYHKKKNDNSKTNTRRKS